MEAVSMYAVKTGFSITERAERLIASKHHKAVLERLGRLRMTLETDAGEEWTTIDAPIVLILNDVCDYLGLDDAEKEGVLGQSGILALSELLDSRFVLPDNTLLNERQNQALVIARKEGKITSSRFREACPRWSAETLRLDLSRLVAMGLLDKHSDKRGAFYVITRGQ